MVRRKIAALTALAPLLAIAAAGCTSKASSQALPSAPGTTPTASAPSPTVTFMPYPYPTTVDPTKFTNIVTNPYMPLKPGTTRFYKGTKGGVPLQSTYQVLKQTKTILGVKCVVVLDQVYLNGSLEEKTYDWFAQDSKGNVWYFGEDSKEYKNGVVIGTTGTWLSGVNGGKPGIVMQAHPVPGQPYIEEYLPGVAEDTAQILKDNATTTVPAGTYKNVVVTLNLNPLDPSLTEHKYYAPGIGFVYENKVVSGVREIVNLVKVS